MSVPAGPARGDWGTLALACPRCRARIAVAADAAACAGCGSSYPLREGVLHLRAGGMGAPGFDPHYFPEIAAVEHDHYWFVTRRRVVLEALRSAVPDLERRALFDLGCGTGGLLEYLGPQRRAARRVPRTSTRRASPSRAGASLRRSC